MRECDKVGAFTLRYTRMSFCASGGSRVSLRKSQRSQCTMSLCPFTSCHPPSPSSAHRLPSSLLSAEPSCPAAAWPRLSSCLPRDLQRRSTILANLQVQVRVALLLELPDQLDVRPVKDLGEFVLGAVPGGAVAACGGRGRPRALSWTWPGEARRWSSPACWGGTPSGHARMSGCLHEQRCGGASSCRTPARRYGRWRQSKPGRRDGERGPSIWEAM